MFYILSRIDGRIYIESSEDAEITAFESLEDADTFLRDRSRMLRLDTAFCGYPRAEHAIVDMDEDQLAGLIGDDFLIQQLYVSAGEFIGIELAARPLTAHRLWSQGYNPDSTTCMALLLDHA